MVIKPSMELFESMLEDYRTTPSYNAGEQGFTNSHYPHMHLMPLFSPWRQLADVSRSPQYPQNDTRLHNTYNGDVALYYLRGESWRGRTPKIIHYTMLYFKPWYWYEYLIFPLNWKWLECLPLAPETFFVYASRFTVPFLLIFGVITLPRQPMQTSTSVALLRRWAEAINDTPWLYAFVGLWVQWVIFFSNTFLLVFVVVPGIPQLHPYASGVLFASWLFALTLAFGCITSRIHRRLGMLVPVRGNVEHEDFKIWTMFRGHVVFAWLCAVYFSIRTLTVVHEPAAIFEGAFIVSLFLITLSIVFYRLPLYTFRIGQLPPTTIRSGRAGDML